ncbi:MAG TPA: outer membrane lipid asymmetry maintenance protein MlaD [Polyangiales bacterium]|nr:outer membrane lipid asymmetry maintenance protein MlaD [Polyangiales bacterium]
MSQRYTRIEVSVGAFVIMGVLALVYLSFTLGGLHLSGRDYALSARFASVGELKPGAPVKLAGVSVGEVKRISLVEFSAEVEFALDDGLKLPDDTIASIQSAGLLGDAYVSLSPGGSEKQLASGSRISRTEAAVSLTELISKYAFGSPLAAPDRTDAKHRDRDDTDTLE